MKKKYVIVVVLIEPQILIFFSASEIELEYFFLLFHTLKYSINANFNNK